MIDRLWVLIVSRGVEAAIAVGFAFVVAEAIALFPIVFQIIGSSGVPRVLPARIPSRAEFARALDNRVVEVQRGRKAAQAQDEDEQTGHLLGISLTFTAEIKRVVKKMTPPPRKRGFFAGFFHSRVSRRRKEQ